MCVEGGFSQIQSHTLSCLYLVDIIPGNKIRIHIVGKEKIAERLIGNSKA